MTTSAKRYRIMRNAPTPVKMSDFGVARDGRDADVIFHTTFEAEVTVEEYQAMLGDDADITRDMYHVVYTLGDNMPLYIFSNDVLACDSWDCAQSFIINAFRKDAGLEPLGDEVIEDAALGYGEISPDAVRFLMEIYNNVVEVARADGPGQLDRGRKLGLTMSDFIRDIEPIT